MSVKNFIPTLWGAGILKERDRVAVGVKNCNRNWEGQIKGQGDKVKILTIGDVTVSDYTPNSDITDPQELTDSSMFLEITEKKYFHFYVDDVDKAQATEGKGLMTEGQRKAGIAIANTQDDFVFGKYTEAGTTITQASLTAANVFSTFSQILRTFQRNQVPEGMKKILEISPEVAEKLVLAKVIKDMGNTKTIESGRVGEFMGFDIYVSTGVVTSGTYPTTLSHCIARTVDAITFAEQLSEIDAYKPQKRFGDAVKGLYVYGGKVVRPKELVHLQLTTAAETTI